MAEGCEGDGHSMNVGVEYEPEEKPSQTMEKEKVAQFFFEAFRVYIAKDVDWKDLALSYKYFDTDQTRKFKQMAKNRAEEMVDILFDEIEQMTQHEDRFSQLVEAFKDCEYDKLANILEGKIIPKDNAARKLVQEKGKIICDTLLVIDVLPTLVAKSVISQKDAELIRANEKNEGQWAAAFDLLFLIPTKVENWFQRFMRSLIENGQEELAKKIDESCYTKLITQGEDNEEEMLMSCQPVDCDERVQDIYVEVLHQCFTTFIQDLEPDTFLDMAINHGLHDLVSSRDIRERQSTSEKNRAIIEHVRKKGFYGYKKFKDCLSFSDQNGLIRAMDEMETTLLSKVMVEGEVLENVVSDYGEGGASINNLSPNKPVENESMASNPETVTRSLQFDSLLQDVENVSVTDSSPRQSLQSMCRSDSSLASTNADIESFSSLLKFGEGRGTTVAARLQQSVGSFHGAEGNQLGSVANKDDQDQSISFNLDPDQTKPQKRLVDGTRRVDPDRTERKAVADNMYARRVDPDRTEQKGVAGDHNDEVNIQGNNLQGLIDNSKKPLAKELKDKQVMDRGQVDMNITEAERIPVVEPEQEDDDVEDVDISLRDYQEELAQPAIQGNNVIIVAPTGSGKTRVALRIIQEHIRKQKGRSIAKVIFLVNQVALANQQGEECRKQLPHYTSKVISGESQRSKSECLKDFIDRRDILIVTAQVLLDSLVQKEIAGINAFSLLVFDECHHTHANHAFNQIMGMYMQLKFSDKQPVHLPQIVGLTASVGVGKAKNIEKAIAHIKSLMANLDAEVISTVHNNMEELRTYVSLPDEETCTVPRRQNDVFGDNVTKLIKVIEQRMGMASVVKEMPEAAQFEAVLKAPAKKGNAQYTQWVSKLVKETAKLSKQEARRFLFPLRAHLEYYNNALIIHNDARVEDALNYLEGEMSRWKENARMDENEKLLYDAYEKIKRAAKKDYGTNPKLQKLQEMIVKAYRGDRKDSRGIVFVKTRDLAIAIVSWMKETPGLRELNPTQFLGQTQTTVKGMTKAEQDDALKYFRDGKHKLIIATSVAEEGLDISKCNLVIRYDHVTNEIAMVQSRGRGRAQDSKYILIAESGTGMAEKEELNMIREILMRKAIIKLQDDIKKDPRKFKDELHKLQDETNLERQLKALKRKGKIIRSGEFELRCFRCDQFICMSSDVKKVQNAHHVIVDEAVKERVKFIKTEPMLYIDDNTQMCGKQICRSCGENLGPVCIYRTLEFGVAKIEKFLIVDINGRQDNVKKWKSAPFEASALTIDNLKEIIRIRDFKGDL